MTSLVFWSTFLVYQINTKLKINFAAPSTFRKIRNIQQGRLIIYALIILIIAFHLPFINASKIIYLAHLGILSTLYNVPPKKNKIIPLRSIPLLKVILIAYVWASISSILPTVGSFDRNIAIVFSAHFLFILAITLPFDIRDLKADIGNQIITIPNVIGIKATKIVALASLLIACLMLYFFTQNIIIFSILMVAGPLIAKSSPDRPNHYYTIFIDGTIILYFVIMEFFIF